MASTVYASVSTPGPPGIQGPAGPTGYSPQYIVATGSPANTTGNNGDMYLNSSTSDLYGPKASGVWGGIVANIKGAAGAPGTPGYSPQWIVAAGPPTAGQGNNGDMYQNSSTSDIYGPKAAGAWGGIVANIKGATGVQGPPGVGYNPQGAWSSATTYTQGMQVSYAGGLWISLQSSNTNNIPSSSPTFWQSVAGMTDPTNTKGDLIVHGSATTRLPVGATDGMVLTVASGNALGVQWATASGGTPAGATGDVQFRNAAGAFAADTGLFVWDATNHRHGIGTASPAVPLHVVGNGELCRLQGTGSFSSNGVAGYLGYFDTPSTLRAYVGYAGTGSEFDVMNQMNGAMTFGTNGAVRITITSSGNVGIGTTSPLGQLSFGNPASDAALRSYANSDQGNIAFYQAQNFPSANAYQRVLDINAGGSNTGGNIRFLTQNGSAASVVAMFINPVGNVGIGTTTPICTLHVNSSATAGNPATSGSSDPAMAERFAAGSVGTALDFGCNSSGVTWLQNRANNSFATNYPIALNPNGGSVGIGTTSPGTKLSVVSGSSIDGVTISSLDRASLWFTTTDGANRNWLLQNGVAAGDDFQFLASTAAGATPSVMVMALRASGRVGIGLTAPGYMLDVAGDCNLSAGSVYRINGVPISSSGIGTQNTNPGTALGSVYQNTTGKPVFHTVSVSMNSSSGNLIATTDSSSSPSTPVASTSNFSSGFTNMSISFWVLPGNYYKVALAVAGGTLQYWTQWY